METIEKLGRLMVPADLKQSTRDAVHIAVVAVRAAERLLPGERVMLDPDDNQQVMSLRGPTAKPVGIIDPYLPPDSSVHAGGYCWLFLMPKAITGLRHEWTHPLFPDLPGSAPLVAPPSAETNGMGGGVIEARTLRRDRTMPAHASAAEHRLADFAAEIGLSFKRLVEAATEYLDHDEYVSDGGRFKGTYPYDGFWDDYEEHTGRTVPEDKRGSFFSCSC